MSLEYSDDNELVYQAKAVAKDIVNAKYEVTKKVGSFLFLAHSEEEFYQRAAAVDDILDSTSSRRLASVSDSKAKLVKALYQEWELKHASCEECSPKNFKLPERVASPVAPMDENNKKRWNIWSRLTPTKDGNGVERKELFKGENSGSEISQGVTKAAIMDQAIGGSLGRLDDPEVNRQVTPGSAVWIDPHGIYDQDKKRHGDAGLKPSKSEKADAPPIIDQTKFSPMMGIILGRRDAGHSGILTSYHKCTGNSFKGFKNETNSFPPCSHVHHDGDGCGLSSDVAPDGSTQPGCGQHHALVKVLTPSYYSKKSEDGVSRIGATPYLGEEQLKDISGLSPSERQQTIDRLRSSGPSSSDITNSSDEQVGEIPWSRMFLMHPDQSAAVERSHDEKHAATGGEGRHPANLDEFTVEGRNYRVGDIVSTRRRRGSSDPSTEDNLGILVGASSNRNSEHVRLGKNSGLSPYDEGDQSMADSTPGEYSLMVHRIHEPIPGKGRSTVVDPETNRIRPEKNINESTSYYPSSNVDVVEPYDAEKLSKDSPKKSRGIASKLYSAVKRAQETFRPKPTTVKNERSRTVSPSKGSLDYSDLDISSLFE